MLCDVWEHVCMQISKDYRSLQHVYCVQADQQRPWLLGACRLSTGCKERWRLLTCVHTSPLNMQLLSTLCAWWKIEGVQRQQMEDAAVG